MISRTLVNGVESDVLRLQDRGLHYGDGVFRTLLVDGGVALELEAQLSRLHDDARRIGLDAPDVARLRLEAQSLCHGMARGVLKIILTRGESARGYQPRQGEGTRILLLYPPPDLPIGHWRTGVRVRVCSTRLSRNPALAGIKHLNRLEQVLARAEWGGEEIAEGLMLDTQDHLVGGVSSNLFLVRDGVLKTAELSQCGVAGVMRGMLLDAAPVYTRAVRIEELGLEDLLAADECFVCNSVIRIWPIRQLDRHRWEAGPVTRALQEKFAAPWLRAN